MFSNQNQELPITALCVLTDRTKCPPNYIPIFKAYDINNDTDLWKDGLFGRKINRFICYTKDYPINETYNVIEDVKLLNEKEILSGFIPVEKCYDTNDKCFQKKVLCIKVSGRFFTSMAVSDIIILVKSKRPPNGYTYIGDINNHTICVKFSAIPSGKPSLPPHSQSSNQVASSGNVPPIPPRPASFNMSALEQSFVHVDKYPKPYEVQPNDIDFYNTMSINSSITNTVYNPLQGVPFELNPIYALNNSKKANLGANQLETMQEKSNDLLNRIPYDFSLERTLIESN